MEDANTIQDWGLMGYALLAGYLVLLLVLGVMGYRRSERNEEDYYLAGRGQGWVVSSLTIMATFFSSFALLGAPGMVYRDGVVFALFALNVPVGGAAVYLIGSRLHEAGKRHGYVTPADMISDHYNSPIGMRIVVAVIGFLYAVPYVVMQIQAGGIISQQLFQGTYSFEIGSILLALITMLYIMIGGMRSVAWTDVIQGLLLVGGMLIAGFTVVYALGGIGGFLSQLRTLPGSALTFPGVTGSWTPEKLLSVCFIAALGSMIQPAQWMRYYAADSKETLRRSALIFAGVLTACYLFGVMLVGLGGQVLYPLSLEGGNVLPHPDVGKTSADFDQILVIVLKHQLPELFGQMGVFLSALIMIAIMAAAMSTADSNLHALSALVTRDLYDRFINPSASQARRTWIGRIVIVLATVFALCIVMVSRHSLSFNPVAMIAQMGLLAIAFSSQLLPVTVDMLFIRKGCGLGALWGMIAGLVTVLFLSPLFASMFRDIGSWMGWMDLIKAYCDIGALGVLVNLVVFYGLTLMMTKNRK